MQALWIDGFEIRIDALPHVYLDVGLGAGLDVRVIFGEVDLAEIERLKLLRRKATAHRLLRGAPEIAVERLELGTALLLDAPRSEEPTSELQSLMRISYAVFCSKKKKQKRRPLHSTH